MIRLPLNGQEPVEELVEEYPAVQAWLSEHGVICVECGQVYWGSLNELCASRRQAAAQTVALVRQLNEFLRESTEAGR